MTHPAKRVVLVKRIAVLALGLLAFVTIAFASPAEAKPESVDLTTPFGSISIASVKGPAKGKCIDIPVTIDVEDAKRVAEALPLRVSITDESEKPVAVVIWNPTRRPPAERKYHVTMKACGKPHTYAVPLLGRGYNVVTWDPRGEFVSGGTIQLDSEEFENFDIYSYLKDYEFRSR